MRAAVLSGRKDSRTGLAITGIGMVCSVGLNAATACAAARAGVVRSVPLDYFFVRSPEDGSVEPVVGHSVPFLTMGFEGNTRLMRLMQAALSDLRTNASLPSLPTRTGFYLSLPDPVRLNAGKALIPEGSINDDDEPETSSEDDGPDAGIETDFENESSSDEPVEDEDVSPEPNEETVPFEVTAKTMLQQAAELAGWTGEVDLRGLAISGTTGVAEVLEQAAEDLRSGQVTYAVIGGADSWLDEDALLWLEQTARLKTPASPTGLQPGEGAAFLLLEPERNYRDRDVHPLAFVVNLRLSEDPNSLLSGTVSRGRVLADLIQDTVESAEWDGAGPPWLITDQNGEPYRALEWGNANVAVLARCRAFQTPILWYPAASFGDTGAASGAVAAAMAIRAFARAYAPSPVAAIVSSADAGNRSVILLRCVE